MTFIRFKQRPGFASINNLIDSANSSFPSTYRNEFLTGSFKPSVPVNVIERENGYILEIVAPGFEKDEFSINIDQNMLIVSGSKKEKESLEGEKKIRTEYATKEFKKSFSLPELTDAEQISAQYVNGVLTLNLPVKAEVKEQTKQITIQ